MTQFTDLRHTQYKNDASYMDLIFTLIIIKYLIASALINSAFMASHRDCTQPNGAIVSGNNP